MTILLAKIIEDAEGKQKHVHSGFTFYAEHVSRIADPAFVSSVRAYFEKTQGFFAHIEELRMNLAKHEVPRTKGQVAEMPGYARMDQIKGTLYWFFIGVQGGLEKLDRRETANLFLDIQPPDCDYRC